MSYQLQITGLGYINSLEAGIAYINAPTPFQGALQVKTNGGGVLINSDNANFGLAFRNSSSSNKLWDISSFNNDFVINEGGIAARMYFKAGGAIGIGTTTPISTLDVVGTGKFSGQLTLGSTITNGTFTYTLPGATGTLALTTDIPSLTANAPLSYVGGVLSISQANTSTNGYLSSTDWNTFNNKQIAGDYITALTGEATATGPGSAAITLSNSAVIGKVLTGLSITGGTIGSTDSILTAFGKVQNQINSLVGGVNYQGTWNASTNTPALASSVGTKGYYYVVSVAGSTNLNGITDWQIGDWAIYDGTAWQKVDNTDTLTSVGITSTAAALSISNSPLTANGNIGVNFAGNSAQYVAGDGTLASFPSLTGYVPYTGATTDVDLGTHVLNAQSLHVKGTAGAGHLGLKHQTAAPTGSANESLIFADVNGNLGWQNDNLYLSTFVSNANTANRTYTLPNADGTLALTSDIPSLSATAPISYSGGVISISQSTTSTNGYLSSTDWNTFNNKQNALTNPVTGTGTTNTLPKFTGTSAIGNSNITDTGSLITLGSNSYVNGSLGIGTSTLTAYSLRVSKNITGSTTSYGIMSDGTIQSDATSSAFMYRSYPSTQAATFNITNLYGFNSSQNSLGAGTTVTNQYGYWCDALSWGTNVYGFYGAVASGTGRWNLYMNGTANNYLNGNTGIGSTIPSGKLEVNVGSSAAYFTRTAGDNGAINPALAILTSSTASRIYSYGTALEFFTAAVGGTTTEKMRLDSNGSLGLGSTTLTGYSLRVSKSITGSTSSFGIINDGIVQSGVTTQATYIQSNASTAAASFTIGSLRHFRALQGTIGAGSTVTSQYGFEVDSSLIGATNNYGFYGNIPSGTNRWNLYMSGTADNYLAGSLGVGTNAPSAGVTSYSTNAATQFKAAGVAPAFTFSDTLTSHTYGCVFGLATANGHFVTGTAPGDMAIANQSTIAGAIVFGTGTTEKMRMTSAGTFSIGNTNSTYTLDVSGTGRFTGALTGASATFSDLITASYGSARIQVTSTTNSANSGLRLSAKDSAGTTKNAGLYYVAGTTTATTFMSLAADDNNYQFNVLANGNVGIGTSTPQGKLDITGTTSGDLLYLDAAINTDFAFKIVAAADDVLTLRRQHSTQGNKDIMSWGYSGNVGIGTSSPSSLLEIAATSPTLRINSTTGGNDGILAWYVNTNYIGDIRTNSGSGAMTFNQGPSAGWGGYMVFKTDTSERMRITSGGEVLIGKTTTAIDTNGLRVDSSGVIFSSIINSNNSYLLRDTTNTAYRFYVSGAGTVFATNTTISAISDIRWKENIRDINFGLNEILLLKPRTFDWKDGKGKNIKNDRGFIAQEFEQIFPDLVDEWKDDNSNNENPYKSIRADLIPILVKAIQELKAEIDELKNK